jgi:predicted TIM-barrel fold metal-dependent hydrolase
MQYGYVDADSHVVELGGTWEEHIEAKFADRRPMAIDYPHLPGVAGVPGRPERDRTWLVDGALQPRHYGPGGVLMSTPADMAHARHRPVTPAIQGLADVAGRSAAMRERNVVRSVLYSTWFLQPPSDDLEYEAALARAWNRFAADRCRQDPSMFRFAAVVPLRDTHLAVQVAREARALGAETAMILPTAGERMLHESHLDPFWATLQDLDMRAAIHIGWGDPRFTATLLNSADLYLGIEVFMWNAYVSMLASGVFDRFAHLKLVFVEHEPRWLELFLHRAEIWYHSETAKPWPSKKSPREVLREHAIYFTYEGELEYLPTFLAVAGQDRVMAALDFPHSHYEGERMSSALGDIADDTGLDAAQKRRVLRDNAVAFYGWKDV